MQVFFSSSGAVAAAAIRTYLLERPRVTQLAQGERSFHVFYQLLAGADDGTRAAAKLSDKGRALGVGDFAPLAQSGCAAIEGVSDAAKLRELQVALQTVGIEGGAQLELFTLVAGVLHLTNLRFAAAADEEGSVVEAGQGEAALETAGGLLGCGSLREHLTTRLISTGHGSFVTRQLSPAEAARTRDTVARIIYTHAFDWLAKQLNAFLAADVGAPRKGSLTLGQMVSSGGEIGAAPPAGAGSGGGGGGGTAGLRFIGLLDIFGFERFERNSFEQLCINYCNEKLHQFFLKCVFKTEQELYEAEGVRWPKVDFQDNQGCIDGIEKNPHGVLRLLDAQARAPRAPADHPHAVAPLLRTPFPPPPPPSPPAPPRPALLTRSARVRAPPTPPSSRG